MQQAAAQAYGAVAKQIANPRDLESSLLLKAASKLQAVYDNWDAEQGNLYDALLYNRKLWTVFMGAVTSNDSPLPVEVRQNVANLGIFIMNQTLSLTQSPQRERLPSLININREIAAGLRGQG
jgi:flagellar protein FlaF